MTRPPHVARVYERYGVTTRRALLRAVRDTFNEMFVEEGEERFTLRDAEVLLDREFSAEYERLYGGAYDW